MTKRMPNVISFFGPEGAGKTTHARTTIRILKQLGFRTKYVSIRDHHFFAYALFKFLNSRDSCDFIIFTSPFQKVKIPSTEIMKKIANLWLFLEFVSLILVNFIKVIIPVWAGYKVVADRYLHDSIITISYWITNYYKLDNNSLKMWNRLASILYQFIREDTVAIYLDVTYEEATVRYRRRSPSNPARRDLFGYYKETGMAKPFCGNTVYINTTGKSAHQTQKRIRSFLGLPISVQQ